VLLFDPTNAKSSAYNPLLEVRRGEWEVRDVQNIADILVDPEGSLEKAQPLGEDQPFALLVGAILHVLYAEADKTLAGVAAFLSDPKRRSSRRCAMMKTPHLGEPGRIRSSPAPRASCSTNPTTNGRACCRPRCRSSASIAIPSWPRSPPLRLAHRRHRRRQSRRRSTSSCRRPTSTAPSR
jgi:hypothetical protein